MRDQYEELCAMIRSRAINPQTRQMKKPAEILNLSRPKITQADIDREVAKLQNAKGKQ